MDILLYVIVGIAALLFFGGGIAKTVLAEQPGQGKSVAKKSGSQKEAKLPYVPRKSLLTPNELSFFSVLHPMIGAQWHLFSKVRVEDIIEVPKSIDYKEKQSLRGRIKSRHFDFVICDAKTLSVLMCIELDDKSHQRAKAKEADAFKDRAMRDAGVPLIRVPARQAYSAEYVKSHIFEDEDPAEMETPEAKQSTP